MNQTLKWGTALMLALATVSAPAIARDDRGDRGRHGYSQRDQGRQAQRHDSRRDSRDNKLHRRAYADAVRHDRRHNPPPRVVHHRPVVHHVHRPPPPRYHGPPPWARGGYVHHYQRPVYVVHDYRGYGLRHPPRGYRWYRDDYGDYLLIAIATGLIADLILHH